MTRLLANPVTKRLLACLGGGFVLALMIGDQEGTQTDFGIAFRHAVSMPRIAIFLLVGLAVFAAITFWPLLAPYIRRPAASGVVVGFLLVLVALQLMNWYDPVGKFGKLSDLVSRTTGLDFLPAQFFGWLAYTLWLGCLVLGVVAIIVRSAALGWALAAVGAVSAVVCFVAQMQLVDFAVAHNQGQDHSLGVYVGTVGFLVYAGAGLVIARSHAELADPAAFVERVMAWRPGLPTAAVGVVLALFALASATWFSPLQLNLEYGDLADRFSGTGAGALAMAYVQWLGVVLAVVTAVAALAASYLRNLALGVVTAVLGLLGVLATLITLHGLSAAGVRAAPKYGALWQNLGAGGWVATTAFGLLATTGLLVLWSRRPRVLAPADAVGSVTTGGTGGPDDPGRGTNSLPLHAATAGTGRSAAAKAILPVALVVALFYPPTLPTDWQTTVVTSIGPYLLLAVGLNVVVGWAGLLDLGYIAFYGIGSYTTAYVTGSLPIKPPSWLHLSPLWAIPFAIIACLIAGVLLGAPTLRLRGDYLAIVTLGFGEIVQVVAINAQHVTGGPTGPTVPNPVLDAGPLKIHWGLDNLPYWYLLLLFLIIVVVLFYRLEGSRLGRAWAAIREDEIAAQATGINTTRVKLLAFAIGASTSGLAGVFYATQVGYFDPQSFTLQNSILIVAYVVFGGMGSLPGAIAGAAVLTWLPQFLKAQVPLQDRQMWIGAIVLLMMIFRPAGLIPAKRRAAELHGLDTAESAEVHAVPASEGL